MKMPIPAINVRTQTPLKGQIDMPVFLPENTRIFCDNCDDDFA